MNQFQLIIFMESFLSPAFEILKAGIIILISSRKLTHVLFQENYK